MTTNNRTAPILRASSAATILPDAIRPAMPITMSRPAEPCHGHPATETQRRCVVASPCADQQIHDAQSVLVGASSCDPHFAFDVQRSNGVAQ